MLAEVLSRLPKPGAAGAAGAPPAMAGKPAAAALHHNHKPELYPQDIPLISGIALEEPEPPEIPAASRISAFRA